jgi:hypothetical protein
MSSGLPSEGGTVLGLCPYKDGVPGNPMDGVVKLVEEPETNADGSIRMEGGEIVYRVASRLSLLNRTIDHASSCPDTQTCRPADISRRSGVRGVRRSPIQNTLWCTSRATTTI